jgi:hypothetical protein
MNIILTPAEKARQLRTKFGNKAVGVVNEIIKYSPNRPLDAVDPIAYFNDVKNELKNG